MHNSLQTIGEYAIRVPTCRLDVYRRESGGLPRGPGKSDRRSRFRTSDAGWKCNGIPAKPRTACADIPSETPALA